MRYLRLTRTHARAVAVVGAIGVLCVVLARPADIAQGRVDPLIQGQVTPQLSGDVVGTAIGGGTVVVTSVPSVIASFGINGKRPTGFVSGGAAVGRINYDKHAPGSGRHVNVPVLFMTLELSATPSQNGTGGKAQLIGDCGAPAAECPSGTGSVVVYVEDNSDTGASDMFNITYCAGPAAVSPTGCVVTEGGRTRTGQIQIRATGPSGSAATVPTAARAPLRLP